MMQKLYTKGLALACLLTIGHQAVAQTTWPATHNVHVRSGHPIAHPSNVERGGVVNDDCSTAAPIALLTEDQCATLAVAGNNADATTSTVEPGCDPGSAAGYQDMWYSFNTGENEVVNITLTPSADMTDWVFTVLDGCEGTELQCVVQPGGPVPTTLTPNTTYYIRVYSNLDWGVGGAFTLCVVGNGGVPEPPANDDCANVIEHALAVGASIDITGDNTGATDGEGLGFNSTWESFTLTDCADVTVDYCATAPAFADFIFALSTSCPAGDPLFTTTQGVCGDGNNATMNYASLPAGTYYIPVIQDAGATGAYSIHVAASACPAPPANDDCAGALPIVSSATCVTTSGTTLGSTQSMDPLECNTFTSSAAMDVWYSFVATSTDQNIAVQGSADFDVVMELFEGNCASLTSIGCSDSTTTDVAGAVEDIEQSGLTIGSTYYVRVYSWNNGATDPTFSICVKEGLSGTIGIAEHTAPVDFTVFPNPTTGAVTLTYMDASALVTIELVDMTGRTVISQQRALTKGQNIALDLTGKVAAGNYALRLSSSTGRSAQRLVVR